MIHENKQFRTCWDIFVIVLSIWICFVVPFDIAFQPLTMKSFGFKVFNHVIDAIYVVDIFLNFRTTISDFVTGDEITDSKEIAIQYLKGRFFIDLLAAIPFELIS